MTTELPGIRLLVESLGCEAHDGSACDAVSIAVRSTTEDLTGTIRVIGLGGTSVLEIAIGDIARTVSAHEGPDLWRVTSMAVEGLAATTRRRGIEDPETQLAARRLTDVVAVYLTAIWRRTRS